MPGRPKKVTRITYFQAKRKAYKPDKTALVKKVNKLARAVKGSYTLQYLQNRGSSTMAAPYLGINLIQWPAFKQIYGTGAPDWVDENSFVLKTMKVDLIMRIANELDNVDYSMFVVQLKGAANTVYDKSTGALSLTQDLHYARNDLGDSKEGSVFLNPSMFKILLQRRFTIGNNGQAISSGAGLPNLFVNKRVTKTFVINQTYTNPAGNVSALAASIHPSKQYYILFFNNNLSGDLQHNVVDYNIINTIKVSD